MKKIICLVVLSVVLARCADPSRKKDPVQDTSGAAAVSDTVPPAEGTYILLSDTMNCDTVIAGQVARLHILQYDKSGRMIDEKYDNGEKSVYSVLLRRSFYPNGNLQFELIGAPTCCTGPEWYRTFDENGNAILVMQETDLDPLPGEQDEFNHPTVWHEQNFVNGKLSSEGYTYANCGECGRDSCGKWNFFEGGRPVVTRTFPEWKKFYTEAGGKLR